MTDESILASVMRNLLDNAVKYGAEGSRIGVRVSREACDGWDGMALTISNQLGEVELPDPDKVFMKYYRAPRAHRRPGSGLGLFLVAGWMKALGGQISYHHRPLREGGVAVHFRVWLPS